MNQAGEKESFIRPMKDAASGHLIFSSPWQSMLHSKVTDAGEKHTKIARHIIAGNG